MHIIHSSRADSEMSEKEKDLADIYILDGFSYLVHRNFDLFSRIFRDSVDSLFE